MSTETRVLFLIVTLILGGYLGGTLTSVRGIGLSKVSIRITGITMLAVVLYVSVRALIVLAPEAINV